MNENKKNQKRIKEIADRIFLEKYREEINGKDFYVVSLEMKKFSQLFFTANFTGSKNITFLNGENFIQKTEVLPYTKKIVARLLLNKGWNLKTKFSFTLGLPSIELQEEYLVRFEKQIQEKLQHNKYLRSIDFTSLDITQIHSLLKGQQFIDLNFSPVNTSLEKSKEDIIKKNDMLIQWRMPTDYLNTKETQLQPKIDFQNFKAIDIKVGKLQTNWILSSLAALAETPEKLEQIFITNKYQEQGLYKLKLRQMGFQKLIVIDSYFPCIPEGDPVYSKSSDRQEMIPQLIEKAFAKLYSSYGNLRYGKPSESLFDMTGYPTIMYQFYDEEISKLIQDDKWWVKMVQWHKDGQLMTASTQEIKNSQIQGLLSEHTYTILKIVEINGIRLINLRNPWGVFEWSGDYSKNSDKWNEDLLRKLNPQLDDDSQFWISYEHFIENFEEMLVCHYNKKYQVVIKGKLIKGVDSRYNLPYLSSRYFYNLKIHSFTKLIIGIHQQDQRKPGVKITRPYIDIGIVILQKKESQYFLIGLIDSELKRDVFYEIELPQGEYIVLPRSEGVCLNFKREMNEEIMEYDIDHPLFQSVLEDIFQKYDLDGNQTLTLNDMEQMFRKFNMNFEVKDIQHLFQNNKLESFNLTQIIDIFRWLWSSTSIDQQKNILKHLGYDDKLFSYRTRVISLSFNADQKIEVEIQDAFSNCLDMIARQLIIQKFGINIEGDSSHSSNQEVEAYYYFNKKIHCYSYSILNRTNKTIKAKLDLLDSKNMVTDYAMVIKKEIPPFSLEFIMSAQNQHFSPGINYIN